MSKIFWYSVIYGSALASVFQPWLGIVVGYLIVILGPQFIWFWAVPSKPFFTVAVSVIAGFLFQALAGRIDFSRLKTPINLSLLIWFIFILLSYSFGPYVSLSRNYALGSKALFTIYWKIFLFYFLAVLLIDERKKYALLVGAFLVSIFYLIYWANMQYLSGVHFRRLPGPRSPLGSAYADQNAFAMVFVVGSPFFYYLAYLIRKKILRLLTWCVIPFSWHAVFLTASRGGLLGIVSTIFIGSMRSPKKFIGLLLIPFFFFIYQWQGGSIMKQRAETISNYEHESSAQTRLQAWRAASRMIAKYPLFGVGPGSFVWAFPDFSDKTPRQAHNTFLQIAAEYGIIAGINYIILLILMFKTLHRASKKFKDKDPLIYLISEALFVSLFGFVVCALFISLHVYEIFFYFCVLVNFIYLYEKNVSIQNKKK